MILSKVVFSSFFLWLMNEIKDPLLHDCFLIIGKPEKIVFMIIDHLLDFEYLHEKRFLLKLIFVKP
jgi:hypothetical protein